MRSVTSVTMRAPADRIYALAHDTLRWPALLPHYRFVRLLEARNGEQLVEMAARRGWIPVRWTALQRNDAREPAIYFHHTSGWTRGMDVVWRFEPRDGGTQVSIVHDVVFSLAFAPRWIEEWVVTKFFIEGIAARTLACFKRLAEDGPPETSAQ
ncbi:MAG TPA: SRPBCC family protein [Candidatus Baltobacteraceae bacterium]|nr:SRPBCC family protein [Candidatus Baltobacteraceae bacterium]